MLMNDSCYGYYVCFPGGNQINDELNIVTNKLGTRKEVLDFTNILLKHKLTLMNNFKEKHYFFFFLAYLYFTGGKR